MAKQGEIDYLKNIGPAAVQHAARKPWSEFNCGRSLMEIGAVMTLLPRGPMKLLDVGCGTGWTSLFFAKAGYDVTGIDIAPDMIRVAEENRVKDGVNNARFLVADYEDNRFDGEFDCVVFFDSLHHAVDEQSAVNMAWRALRPGGVCVTSEPGHGHHDTREALDHATRFNVTEKDMPPGKIAELGRKAGFRAFRAFPHAFDLNQIVYSDPQPAPAVESCLRWLPRLEALLKIAQHNGILLMTK